MGSPVLPLSEAREVRDELIANIAAASRRILLEPKPGPKVEESVSALDDLLKAALAATETLSTSNRGYAVRDLPADVSENLTRAQHNLDLLKSAYYPRAKEAND